MKAGWKLVKLGELCNIKTGKKDVNEGCADGLYPFFTCAATHTYSNVYSFDTEALLIAGNGDVGRVSYYKGKFEAYQRTYVLSGFTEVLPRFLFLILDGKLKERVSKQKLGNTMPYIKMGMLTDFVVPVPPLPEQQRIVSILDEAFAGIATARTAAEQNRQNARALFESHLQSVFSQRGEGWVEKRLGDVAEVQSGGTPTVSKKEYWNGGIPWYSSGELNSTFTTVSERRITTVGLENSNAKLFPEGSLLIGMYDTAALKMSILDCDGAFNQAIAGVKPNDQICVEFVLHAINAKKPRLLLERRGVRQKNLSLGKIKDISIPLPSMEEQIRVVERLREAATETQRLESLYQRKLEALDELKQSLLHQAFSGQL